MSAQGIFYSYVKVPSVFYKVYHHYFSNLVFWNQIELRNVLRIDSYDFVEDLFYTPLRIFTFEINSIFIQNLMLVDLTASISGNFPQAETIKWIYDF